MWEIVSNTFWSLLLHVMKCTGNERTQNNNTIIEHPICLCLFTFCILHILVYVFSQAYLGLDLFPITHRPFWLVYYNMAYNVVFAKLLQNNACNNFPSHFTNVWHIVYCAVTKIPLWFWICSPSPHTHAHTPKSLGYRKNGCVECCTLSLISHMQATTKHLKVLSTEDSIPNGYKFCSKVVSFLYRIIFTWRDV